MGRYASIRDCCDSIRIESRKDVNRLKRATLDFVRANPPADGASRSFLPIARAFIEEQGGDHFSAHNGVDHEILAAVVGILKVQRRYQIDNEPRLNQTRLAFRGGTFEDRRSDENTGPEEDGASTGGRFLDRMTVL